MSCSEVEDQNMAERYLLDQVTESEREEYEKHYLECRPCFDRLQTHLALQRELQLHPAPATLASRPLRAWIWVPALAVVLLLIGLGAWWSLAHPRASSEVASSSPASLTPRPAPATPPLAAPLLAELARVEPPPYDAVMLRGAEDASQKSFREAMRHYERGDYARAVPGLQAAAESSPRTPRFQFYLGVCYLLTNQTDRAIEALGKAAALDDPAYSGVSHFYLAKAHLAKGNLQGAEAELRETVRIGGAREAEARRILRELGTEHVSR